MVLVIAHVPLDACCIHLSVYLLFRQLVTVCIQCIKGHIKAYVL